MTLKERQMMIESLENLFEAVEDSLDELSEGLWDIGASKQARALAKVLGDVRMVRAEAVHYISHLQIVPTR